MVLEDLPLITPLRAAAGLLDPQRDAVLRSQIMSLCDRSQNPNLRIAVFGPFNFGKSTLLNALLGERTLPMDLIPTTGAAILVKAGPELHTQITLTDGTVIAAAGTAILEDYAILDQDRRMRSDVAAVAVQCPHALLDQGIEFLDLPGTNDRESQDHLVQEQLLQADLVIQIVDGRQLMTLLEREQLRDWLLDRGISSVIFVVNFLNLVEPADQQKVMTRLRAIAESFRTHLPAGVSNLYRVDALPALRAKLKGDSVAIQTTGLPMLESAIQGIVATQQSQLAALRQPRLARLAEQVQAVLQPQVQALEAEMCDRNQRHQQKLDIKRKAQTLLRQDFQKQVTQLRDWLTPGHLLQSYQVGAAQALIDGTFDAWISQTLRPAWKEYQRAVVAPVNKACDFFEQPRLPELWVQFAIAPPLDTDAPPPLDPPANDKEKDLTPVAVATGVGLLFTGPVGAAVLGGASYLLSQREKLGSTATPASSASASPSEQASQAVHAFLTDFSHTVLNALDQYQATAMPILTELTEDPPPDLDQQQHHLRLLTGTLAQLIDA